jgi:hypothetical protein
MTVTLDGKTLDVKSLGEDFQAVNSQWDAWENQAYKRKLKVVGKVRQWTLDCVENNVAWASSQAKSFQDSATAGSTVSFSVTDEVRVINTTVYILGVQIHVADLAGKNIRYFTLSLQEA